MGILKEQKELQKKYYETQEKEQEKPEKASSGGPAPRKKSKPKAKPITSKKLLNDLDKLVADDMATYKGLPIEDKLTIKAKLVTKYQANVERILASKQKANSLLLNAFIIWLYDLGKIEEFLDTINQAITMGQRQTILPQKTYQLVKLYWIMDWSGNQRDQGASYEPYFSQVFDSVKDWKLPKRIREGYWYLKFYSLLNRGKLEEAAKIGIQGIKHGAEIKTNLKILGDVISGKLSKTWSAEERKFI